MRLNNTNPTIPINIGHVSWISCFLIFPSVRFFLTGCIWFFEVGEVYILYCLFNCLPECINNCVLAELSGFI